MQTRWPFPLLYRYNRAIYKFFQKAYFNDAERHKSKRLVNASLDHPFPRFAVFRAYVSIASDSRYALKEKRRR